MKMLIAVLIGSSMALSFAAGATPCEDLWAYNPQAKSESFIRMSEIRPDITNQVKEESINLCESSAKAAHHGVSIEYVLSMVNRSSRGLPDAGRLSMAFMAIGGWDIGKQE